MIVFDFDGTATFAEVEAEPFVAGYRADLAALFGLAPAECDARIDAVLAQIARDPAGWSFELEGRAVCPASVDPYLRMSAVYRELCRQLGRAPDDAVSGRLYADNYARTLERPAFRPDAAEVFEALRGREVYVVTNSGTHHVQAKVRALGQDWLVPRVHGNARKFVVDDAFDAVPAELRLPGLGRPVLLRRRPYHDVLDGLRRAAGVAWSEVVVVGDIFELDLALPQALGARVVLVGGPHTPPWERAWMADAVVASLRDVLPSLSRPSPASRSHT